jgi:hypothetical protein
LLLMLIDLRLTSVNLRLKVFLFLGYGAHNVNF